MNDIINAAFIGNPNCGKTTLFNAYTGANLKVANWPGVTVEKKEGRLELDGKTVNLVDLPGIYSLTSYTMEERLSREYVLSDDADVIINIVDASSLERNIYLTLQLIELGKPVVLALNMMDIVEERGMKIDIKRLENILGISVIPVSARKKTGLDVLINTAVDCKMKSSFIFRYDAEIENKINIAINRLKRQYHETNNLRWLAVKTLEHDESVLQSYPINMNGLTESLESQLINQRYAFIEKTVDQVLVNKKAKSRKTDKIDALLIHPVWGMPIFFVIMAFVFFMTFTVGDFLKGYFELALEWLSVWASNLMTDAGVSGVVRSLTVDGIIAGVGGILTFLPNIFILFLALAFLEDSGYMSRVAYVMDSVMSKLGLSGRAFIPMLLGFGCSVPAVMASRTLEDRQDRIKTILATPFMSCSARLPVYVLLSGTFFPNHSAMAAYSMYIVGILAAILTAKIVRIDKSARHTNTLLIELPEYKIPNSHTVFIYVWEKIKDYVTKAGTTIFLASVVLWVLLNFGPDGMTGYINESYAAHLGKLIAPLLAPAGLGQWQTAVALIAGIAAKEVVVSSLSVLYGIGNIFSAEGMSTLAQLLSASGFTAVNAYSMMLFCLLYIPCIATVAAVRRETNSVKYTLLSIGLHLAFAWTVSTVFYQIASLTV